MTDMRDLQFWTEEGRPVLAVTAEQMREVDRLAAEAFGLDLLQMMENAGRNLAENIMDMAGAAGGAGLASSMPAQATKDLRFYRKTELSIIGFAVTCPLVFFAVPALPGGLAADFVLKMIFILISVICGLFIGAQFPLANRIYLQNSPGVTRTAGLLYAADLLGGWFGGIIGAALATHWDVDEAIERARICFVNGKPFSDYTLPVISLIKGRRMDRLLREHLDFEIEDLPTPFFCLSAHLDTGTITVHERGNVAEAVRAGASIPGIIPPAVVDRRLAVDGAVVNNLPVDIMQRKPVGTIVAVDLGADKQYEVDYPDTPSAWAVLRGRYLPFSRRYKVPAFSTVMLKATELGTLERVRELGRQADLLLKPPVRQFGMTEVRAFDRIVEAGYEHAMEVLPAWLEQGHARRS
mgnify:CR=1 FL=1